MAKSGMRYGRRQNRRLSDWRHNQLAADGKRGWRNRKLKAKPQLDQLMAEKAEGISEISRWRKLGGKRMKAVLAASSIWLWQ